MNHKEEPPKFWRLFPYYDSAQAGDDPVRSYDHAVSPADWPGMAGAGRRELSWLLARRAYPEV